MVLQDSCLFSATSLSKQCSLFFLTDRKINSLGHFSFLNVINNPHLQNCVKMWIRR